MRQAGRYMSEYRALRERYSLLESVPHARSGDRSHAAAGAPHRRRRGDPLLRSAAAARADGHPLRFRQGRRTGDRESDPVRATTSTRLRRFEPREALSHVLDGHPADQGRAARPGAADRLRRRAVHAGVLRDRGRPLEQLRADQGADVRHAGRVASALRAVRRRRRPTTSSRRSKPASTPCRCSTRGWAR